MIPDIAHLWLLSILGKSGVWVKNFSIRASVLDYLRFGNTENRNPLDGQQWYKTTENQLNAVASSNVALVAGQSASASLTGTSTNVVLNGVTAGNTLCIAMGARTPSGSSAHFPTFSDSQSQTISILRNPFVISNAGAYAKIGVISGALSGTHTITVATTDSSQTGEVSIYELSGVSSTISASTTNAGNSGTTHIALTTGLVQLAKQVCIGAAGFEVVSANGYVWSGAVQSLTQDGTDANSTGLNGHFSGAISNNDFGATVGNAPVFQGQALAGVIFI